MKFLIKSGPAPVKRTSNARSPEREAFILAATETVAALRDGQYFIVPETAGLKGGHIAGKIRMMNAAIVLAGRRDSVIAYSSQQGVVVKHVPSGIEGDDDGPKQAEAAPPVKQKAQAIGRK